MKRDLLEIFNLKEMEKIIGKYDFYEFLLKGQINKNLRLQDGDIIFIPVHRTINLRMGGAFKRPYIYEII